MQQLQQTIRLCQFSGEVLRRGIYTVFSLALAFVLGGMMLASPAQAQHDVTGTVTDAETGETLPGVNVQVVGTQQGTVSDRNGGYEVTAPSDDASLRFSFVGYEAQTVDIDGRSTINVGLESATLTGGEVVVTGYRTQRRADLTGSVQVVEVEDLQNIAEAQISDQLQGMAAGVSVISSGQPGQNPQIRIRGINTFGDNTPLFVVDGVPTQDINNLNPDDVANIQVLKDASASIYGARAANGVVIVETKKGQGDMSVSFNSYAGVSQQPDSNPWNILDSQGHADLELLSQCNSGGSPSHAQYTFPGGCPAEGVVPQGSAELPNYVRPAGADNVDEDSYFVIPNYTDPAQLGDFNQIVQANKDGTNWFDELNRTATVAKTDLSVSGGNDQGEFLLGVGYLNEEGTVRRTFLERMSLRANGTYNVTDNVRIGENLSYTVEENQLDDELTEGSSIGMAMRIMPIIPVRDVGGNFGGTAANGLGNASNPIAMRYRTRNDQSINKRLFGNVFAEADLWTDFTLRSSFGGSVQSNIAEWFNFPDYETSEPNTRNQHNENGFTGIDWTWTNTLNFDRTFAQSHNVSTLVGAEWTREEDRFKQASVQDFFSFDPNFVNLANGTGTRSVDSWHRVRALVSQFGKVDYNYESRYFLSGTLRRDGSSKLLEDKYGIFPSASAGWRITEESFMQDTLPWLTDLKFRGGYGVMGNQLNVDENNAYTLFGSLNFGYDIAGTNASPVQGFRRSRLGAPQARWEKVINTNYGLDLAVFDGQLELTLDYYVKQVEDLLFNPELPAQAGQADQPFINVAEMENKGFDGSLRWQTQFGELDMSTSLNLTSYNNEITSVAEGVENFSEETRRFNDLPITRNQEGEEISSYFGYNVVGFFNEDDFNGDGELVSGVPDQDDAKPGRFRYEDVNGDGEIGPDDRTFLGSPNPDFTAGLNLSFRYSSWDLSMMWFGSQGAQVWNQTKWWTHFRSGFIGAKAEEALHESWVPGADNSDATAPLQENERTFSTNDVPNSYFVEDADYLRLRNVQLGYSLPSSVAGQIGAEQLRIYVRGSNLLIFTNYSNPEPEIGGGDATDVTSFGIDEGSYPKPRKYLVGVNLTF